MKKKSEKYPKETAWLVNELFVTKQHQMLETLKNFAFDGVHLHCVHKLFFKTTVYGASCFSSHIFYSVCFAA